MEKEKKTIDFAATAGRFKGTPQEIRRRRLTRLILHYAEGEGKLRRLCAIPGKKTQECLIPKVTVLMLYQV